MTIIYNQKILTAFLFCYCLCRLSVAQLPSSQFFIKHGNNLSQVSCGGLLFAPNRNQNHQAWGAGSVWLRNKIDLRNPLNISFIVDFNDTTAVDGGAFVLQSDSAALGDSFNGLGYRNIKQSIAITFDAKQTPSDNDPSFDHISIQSNGDTKHGTTNELVAPVNIEPFYRYTYYPPPDAPIFAFHHLVTIQWDPVTKLLSVFIDQTLILSTRNDIVQSIFNGNPIVYWGFTASNTQETWYPAGKELTFGYFYFFFGDIYPRYTTTPELDTCFSRPIQFFDASIYASDSFYNNILFAHWYWDFGDGQTSQTRNPPPHQYASAGEYTLKYTVSNHLGCTFDTLTRVIHLGSMPTVDFKVEGPACSNSPILFVDNSTSQVGPPTAFTWNFDNLSSSIEKNPVFTFNDAGSKTVTLHVRTFYGCESEKTEIIEVGDKPDVDFITATDCDGNVEFIPTVVNNVPITNWNWSFGDLAFSIQQAPKHQYKKNGQYETLLQVKSNIGCISETVAKKIFINKIYPFAGNDTILAVGETLPLHAIGGDFYAWIPSTGLSNPNIPDPIVNLDSDQQYLLKVSDSNGCEATDTLNIKVFKGPDVYLPNAFSPNADGRNDVLRLVGPGIKTLEYFRIYDRYGNLLFETKEIKSGWDGTYHGRPQPPNTYVWMISAIDFDGKKFFKKGVAILIR